MEKCIVPALLRQVYASKLRSKLTFAEFVTWVRNGVHVGPYLELFGYEDCTLSLWSL